jgi:hypothetical protein
MRFGDNLKRHWYLVDSDIEDFKQIAKDFPDRYYDARIPKNPNDAKYGERFTQEEVVEV